MSQEQEAIATQPDATANDGPVDQPKSRRELAMEEIAQQNQAKRDAELGIEITPQEVAAEAAPEPEEDQVQSQLNIIDDPRDTVVRVKVDGQEMDVPLDEVLRNYQKGSAADRRLEEATRVLKEAKAQAQAIAPEPQQEHAVTQPKAGPDELKAAVKTALAKVFEGDEDAAAEALTNVLAQKLQPAPQMQQSPIDINAIADQLQQRMQVQNAIEKVRTDYPDILSDPDLDQLTFLKVQAKEAEGVPRAQALLEAADEVYRKMGKTGRQTSQSDTAMREQKLARKAAIDTVPIAHTPAANPGSQDDTSPSAVIAAMAAKRLGQSLPRR